MQQIDGLLTSRLLVFFGYPPQWVPLQLLQELELSLDYGYLALQY